VRKATEQAEWGSSLWHRQGLQCDCGSTAAEEIYSAPAELALEDGELLKSHTNGTLAISQQIARELVKRKCLSRLLAGPLFQLGGQLH
jgi:hypothetical protein